MSTGAIFTLAALVAVAVAVMAPVLVARRRRRIAQQLRWVHLLDALEAGGDVYIPAGTYPLTEPPRRPSDYPG